MERLSVIFSWYDSGMTLDSMGAPPDKKLEKTETEVAALYKGEVFTGKNLGHIREQIEEKYEGKIELKELRKGHRTPDGEFIEE
jgi:hypothetical protein